MSPSLQDALTTLPKSTVVVSNGNGFPELGQASISVFFGDGTRLDAEYWRLIENGSASYSSFDHQQRYGLPEAIDAIEELRKRMLGKTLTAALHDLETGDLVFEFSRSSKLQILNLTGYEIWQISFANGSVEYSNRAK
jgi:hypothetical protein